MSAKDIAEPAEGRKKKRLTAAFVTRLAAFLVCFGVFGVSLYMIVERVIDDIQTNRLIEDLQTAAVERAVPRMTVMPSSSHCQGTSPPVYMTGGSLKNVGRIPFDSSLSWGMSILIVI